ncbi:hypothetical protein J8273_2925 [Carpediemonas membranifera]|uniref:Uncharacterized protein n=1 Tax=Carpediemonas membranifera TaxID=201153 RepID=A0A8J6BDR5_9EUKA|nr:hypothetical protein J8273_2925 [Carpediemonas membranifera]|eukprot:KAG9395367.1 hypothetical protein J8273_2925 [Carpediemonas membranifera]
MWLAILAVLVAAVSADSVFSSLNTLLDDTLFSSMQNINLLSYDLKGWFLDNAFNLTNSTVYSKIPDYTVTDSTSFLYSPRPETSLSDLNNVPSFAVWLAVCLLIAIALIFILCCAACCIECFTLPKLPRPRFPNPVLALIWQCQCCSGCAVGACMIIIAGTLLWLVASTQYALSTRPYGVAVSAKSSVLDNIDGMVRTIQLLPEASDALRYIKPTDAINVLAPQFQCMDYVASNLTGVSTAVVDLNDTIVYLETNLTELSNTIDTFKTDVAAITSTGFDSPVYSPGIGTDLHAPLNTVYDTINSLDLTTVRQNVTDVVEEKSKIRHIEAASVLISLGLGTALNRTTNTLGSLAWLATETPAGLGQQLVGLGVPSFVVDATLTIFGTPEAVTGPGIVVTAVVLGILLLAAVCCISACCSGGLLGGCKCTWCMNIQSCCVFLITGVLIIAVAGSVPALKVASLTCNNGKMWTADLFSGLIGMQGLSDLINEYAGIDTTISIDAVKIADMMTCSDASVSTIFNPAYLSTVNVEQKITDLLSDFISTSGTIPSLADSATFADYFRTFNETQFLESFGVNAEIVKQLNASIDEVVTDIQNMQSDATSQTSIDMSSSGLDISTVQANVTGSRTDVADPTNFGWDTPAGSANDAISDFQTLVAAYYSDNCNAEDFCTACSAEKSDYDSFALSWADDELTNLAYSEAYVACIEGSTAPPDTTNLRNGVDGLKDLSDIRGLIDQVQIDIDAILVDMLTTLTSLDNQINDVNDNLRPDLIDAIAELNNSLEVIDTQGMSDVITNNLETALGVITIRMSNVSVAADQASECSVVGDVAGIVSDGLCETSRGWSNVLFLLLVGLALMSMAHCLSTCCAARFIDRKTKKKKKPTEGDAKQKKQRAMVVKMPLIPNDAEADTDAGAEADGNADLLTADDLDLNMHTVPLDISEDRSEFIERPVLNVPVPSDVVVRPPPVHSTTGEGSGKLVLPPIQKPVLPPSLGKSGLPKL